MTLRITPEFLTATRKQKKVDDNLEFSVQQKYQNKAERKPLSEKQNREFLTAYLH